MQIQIVKKEEVEINLTDDSFDREIECYYSDTIPRIGEKFVYQGKILKANDVIHVPKEETIYKVAEYVMIVID